MARTTRTAWRRRSRGSCCDRGATAGCLILARWDGLQRPVVAFTRPSVNQYSPGVPDFRCPIHSFGRDAGRQLGLDRRRRRVGGAPRLALSPRPPARARVMPAHRAAGGPTREPRRGSEARGWSSTVGADALRRVGGAGGRPRNPREGGVDGRGRPTRRPPHRRPRCRAAAGAARTRTEIGPEIRR